LEGQFLFMARRYDLALSRLTEVVKVQPQLSAGHIMRTYPLIALGRYEEAVQECDTALDLNSRVAGPDRPHSYTLALRGYAMARMGRTTEAERVLTILREQSREQYVSPHHEALLLHALGRNEEALIRLGDAVDGRDLFVTFAGVDPKWDGLRNVPAFRALMARANLLDVSDRARR
jgi:tetratricopeptide (TPR) repeat protein